LPKAPDLMISAASLIPAFPLTLTIYSDRAGHISLSFKQRAEGVRYPSLGRIPRTAYFVRSAYATRVSPCRPCAALKDWLLASSSAGMLGSSSHATISLVVAWM